MCRLQIQRRDHLKAHIQKQHPFTKKQTHYECPICKKIWLFRGNLSKHLAKHHKIQRNDNPVIRKVLAVRNAIRKPRKPKKHIDQHISGSIVNWQAGQIVWAALNSKDFWPAIVYKCIEEQACQKGALF